MPSDRLLTPAEIAQQLGVPLNTFRRNLPALRRDHGFPAPLPGMGGRYDPLAIATWREAQGKAPAPGTPAAAPGEPDTIPDWQTKLDQRARTIAQKAGHA